MHAFSLPWAIPRGIDGDCLMPEDLINRPEEPQYFPPEMIWSPAGWIPEFPGKPGDGPQVYCYTNKYSYAHGETVQLHASSTTRTFDVEVVRDGANPLTVFARKNVTGRYSETPRDCYQNGCNWPVLLEFDVDRFWKSGFYIVTVRTWDDKGNHWEREHFFVVRAPQSRRRPLVLMLTTDTMNAYNDWGGANLYRGLPLGNHDPRQDIAAPWVSTQRPIARGMVRVPPGHPREAHFGHPPPFWRTRIPAFEWARFYGYSRHFNDAFWATWERPFVVWAEQAGYELDFITQQDLDEDPDILTGHRCVITIGHDEYYSFKMRDNLDAFLDAGGNFARFAGNIWDSPLTHGNNGTTVARGASPDGSTPATFNTPINSTFGLSATGYVRYGSTAPRSPGGYLIYNPQHWSLSGTDLYFGDLLGGVPVGIVSFEVDGLDSGQWQFEKARPVVTAEFPGIRDLEIIGMHPAVWGDEDRWEGRTPIGTGVSMNPTGETDATDNVALGSAKQDDKFGREGMCCMASYKRGKGEGFNAGTCEWVQGLIKRDWYVEKVTHNVLARLGGIDSLAEEPNVGADRFPVGGSWHAQ